MLAASAFIDGALQGLIYTVLAALVIGIVRAVIQTTRKRQTIARDNASLTEFFFDTPANPRTRVPAKQGWTTKVDETLKILADGQATMSRGQNRIEGLVHDIRSEVKPDGNGGHNLRGGVDSIQKVITTESGFQSAERGRVQDRDAAKDGEEER